MRSYLVSNSALLNLEEPIKYLGDIHGTDGNFLRLQSAFRELERENEVLRARYIELQKQRPSTTASEDRDRIISKLRTEITTLNSEISGLRGQSSVSVNVHGNTSEFELKIKTLNSTIQELESQIRSQKV